MTLTLRETEGIQTNLLRHMCVKVRLDILPVNEVYLLGQSSQKVWKRKKSSYKEEFRRLDKGKRLHN